MLFQRAPKKVSRLLSMFSHQLISNFEFRVHSLNLRSSVRSNWTGPIQAAGKSMADTNTPTQALRACTHTNHATEFRGTRSRQTISKAVGSHFCCKDIDNAELFNWYRFASPVKLQVNATIDWSFDKWLIAAPASIKM